MSNTFSFLNSKTDKDEHTEMLNTYYINCSNKALLTAIKDASFVCLLVITGRGSAISGSQCRNCL